MFRSRQRRPLADGDPLARFRSGSGICAGSDPPVASRLARHIAALPYAMEITAPKAGDELLKKIGQRFVESMRDTDTIGRLGGFAILLPDTDIDGGVAVADKILKAMEWSVEPEGLSFSLAASIGVAHYTDHGTDASTLKRHADIAMYDAKLNRTGLQSLSQRDRHPQPAAAGIDGQFAQGV